MSGLSVLHYRFGGKKRYSVICRSLQEMEPDLLLLALERWASDYVPFFSGLEKTVILLHLKNFCGATWEATADTVRENCTLVELRT